MVAVLFGTVLGLNRKHSADHGSIVGQYQPQSPRSALSGPLPDRGATLWNATLSLESHIDNVRLVMVPTKCKPLMRRRANLTV